MPTDEKRRLALQYRREWNAWLSVPRRLRNESNCETFRLWYRSARAAWYRAHRWELSQ